MGSFIDQDLIAEKLEMARTLGLVTRYFVRPAMRAGRPVVSVRAWRSPRASDDAVKTYLARLLDGLVPAQEIVVAAAASPSQTEITAANDRGELAPLPAAS